MEKAVIIAAAFALLIIAGYIGYTIGKQEAKPFEPSKPTEAQINETANSLVQTINDAILIKEGKSDKVVFATYIDHGEYIELVYFSTNGTKMSAFISSNLTYLYPAVYTVEGFKANIAKQKEIFKQEQRASIGVVLDGCNDKETMNAITEVQQAINASVKLLFIYKVYLQNETSDPSKCYEGVCSEAGSVEAQKALYGRYIFGTSGSTKWKAFLIESSNCTESSCVDAVAEDLLINTTSINASIMAMDVSYAKGIAKGTKVYINGAAYNDTISANGIKEAVCTAFALAPEGCESILNTTVVNSTC
ncbi:MAG: hypothetical protein QW035_02470 [Candidatus Anstonellales archaeon]